MVITWVSWKELQQLKKEAENLDMFYNYYLCNKNHRGFYCSLSAEYKKAIADDTFVDMSLPCIDRPLPQPGGVITFNDSDFSDDNSCWGYARHDESEMIDAWFYPLIPQES